MVTAATVNIGPLVRQQFNQGGFPLSGGKLFTYTAGTTSKLATYTDSSGTTPNTNPIVLDANGQCDLWLDVTKTYKFVLTTPYDTDPPTGPYWTRDNVPAGTTAGSIIINGVSLQTYFMNSVNLVVPSISALRNVNKQLNTVAFVTGYYNPHDGGGGSYQLDPNDTTSVDNGGTTIVGSDGGRWKLSETGHVTVKQFGAKGDGTTDDTSANASYITWLSPGGKAIYPEGQYSFTSFPNLASKVSYTFEGDGGVTAGAAGVTTFFINQPSASNFIFTAGSSWITFNGIQFVVKTASFTGAIIAGGSNPSNCAGLRVINCSFFGASGARYTCPAIDLDASIECEIDNCAVGSTLSGIILARNSSFCNVIKISRTQFVDTSQIPIQGGGQAISVSECTFEGYNNGTPGNVLAGAFINFASNPLAGFTFQANWLGDVLTAGGTWLNLSGGGIHIGCGNFFGGSAGSSAIGFTAVTGAYVGGNAFNTFGVAITFASASSNVVIDNSNLFQSVTTRFGSVANWIGYSGNPFYRSTTNGKVEIYGTSTVTAGTPLLVNLPVTVGTIENIAKSYSSAPGSMTVLWDSSRTTTGFVLNAAGTGSAAVDWVAQATLPN